MKNETFFEVLKSEVRKDIQSDLRRELDLENQARLDREVAPQRLRATTRHEQLGTWLVTHLNARPMHQSHSSFTHFASRQYQTGPVMKPAAQTNKSATEKTAGSPLVGAPEIAAEPLYQPSTSVEHFAFQLLNSVGANLAKTFTMSELKKSWKHAAFKTHPDRHLSASPQEIARLNERFAELSEAVAILSDCKAI